MTDLIMFLLGFFVGVTTVASAFIIVAMRMAKNKSKTKTADLMDLWHNKPNKN